MGEKRAHEISRCRQPESHGETRARPVQGPPPLVLALELTRVCECPGLILLAGQLDCALVAEPFTAQFFPFCFSRIRPKGHECCPPKVIYTND